MKDHFSFTPKIFLILLIGLTLSTGTIAVYASNDEDDDEIKPTYPKSSDNNNNDVKTQEEYRNELSNMSGKTTREIEELVSIGKYFTEEEKATSLYNSTSICEQLLKRPDVSASGILDCEDILNQTKVIP